MGDHDLDSEGSEVATTPGTPTNLDEYAAAAFQKVIGQAHNEGYKIGCVAGFSQGFKAGVKAMKAFTPKEPKEPSIQYDNIIPLVPSDSHIKVLNLEVRTFNFLTRAGITTVSEVINRSEEQLLSIPNFGDGSLRDLKNALSRHGYSLKPSS